MTLYLPIAWNSFHASSNDPPALGPWSISFPFTNTAARLLWASYSATICVHNWVSTTGLLLISANVAIGGRKAVCNQVTWPSATSNRSSPCCPLTTRIGWMPWIVCKLTQTAIVIASVIFANLTLLNWTCCRSMSAELLQGASTLVTRLSWSLYEVLFSNSRYNSGGQQPVKVWQL